MSPSKPLYSYLSAATLALVTIFTFYVYQNFGPQSVLRRFHVDAALLDLGDIGAISTETKGSNDTRYLVKFVRTLFGANASYEIVNMKPLPSSAHRDPQVLATVEYQLPNGAKQYVVWHVLQFPSDWRIDCSSTWEELAGSVDPGNGLTPN